jgi:hypothetical protein
MLPPFLGHWYGFDDAARHYSIGVNFINPYCTGRTYNFPSEITHSCFVTGISSGATLLILTNTCWPKLAVMSVRKKLTLAHLTISSGIREDERVLGMKFRVSVQSVARKEDIGNLIVCLEFQYLDSHWFSNGSHTTHASHLLRAHQECEVWELRNMSWQTTHRLGLWIYGPLRWFGQPWDVRDSTISILKVHFEGWLPTFWSYESYICIRRNRRRWTGTESR